MIIKVLTLALQVIATLSMSEASQETAEAQRVSLQSAIMTIVIAFLFPF